MSGKKILRKNDIESVLKIAQSITPILVPSPKKSKSNLQLKK